MWAELFQVLLTLLLILAGVHRFILLVESRTSANPVIPKPLTHNDSLPQILIQIPVYNDAAALAAHLPLLHRIDYPLSSLEVQILDDSDDGSSVANGIAVEQVAATGVPIRHLCRQRRRGFKAGALADGLADSAAEFVAVFDVDFQIPADFLLRTLPQFSDSRIGWVQCRWGYTNRNQNRLTRAQARLLDGHFRIAHRARFAAGRFFNFNGTAGIWRRKAIEDAGGWSGETVVEDTDLSLRAWRRGWRAVYRDDIVCDGILPDNFSAFRTQQRRWLAGGMQLCLRQLSRPSEGTLMQKFDLSSRFIAPLASLVVVLLTVWASLRRIYPEALGPDPWVFRWLGTPPFEGIFLFFATLSVIAFYSSTGGGKLTRLWESFLVMILGTGFAMFAAVSCCSGLLGHVTTFERTPKERSSRGGRRYTVWEISLAPVLLMLLVGAVDAGAWSVVPLVSMGLAGLVWSFSDGWTSA